MPKTFVGEGRLYFRPKNTEKIKARFGDTAQSILLSGVILFHDPSILEQYSTDALKVSEIPQEKLVNVKVTIEVQEVYEPEGAEKGDYYERYRIDQILTSSFFSNPESVGYIPKPV